MAQGRLRPKLGAPSIEGYLASRNGVKPSGGAPIWLCAGRRTGPGCAMLYRFPSPGPFVPPQRSRQNGPLAFGVCHSRLLLSALPVTGSGGAFLPRHGLAVSAMRE